MSYLLKKNQNRVMGQSMNREIVLKTDNYRVGTKEVTKHTFSPIQSEVGSPVSLNYIPNSRRSSRIESMYLEFTITNSATESMTVYNPFLTKSN